MALRDNDIELQKNLACFQNYRTLVYKWELYCLQECFRKKTDRKAFKLVNPMHEN